MDRQFHWVKTGLLWLVRVFFFSFINTVEGFMQTMTSEWHGKYYETYFKEIHLYMFALYPFFPCVFARFNNFLHPFPLFLAKYFLKKMRGDFMHSTVCDSNMMVAYSLALYNLHKKLLMKKHDALFFLRFSSVPFQFSYTPFCAVIVVIKH